jgi:hypothetical protein
LMDVGQDLALSFGVGRVHKGLLMVDIDTIHVSSPLAASGSDQTNSLIFVEISPKSKYFSALNHPF